MKRILIVLLTFGLCVLLSGQGGILELDYMEYANDAAAQVAYPSSESLGYGSDVLTGGAASADSEYNEGVSAAKGCDDDEATRWGSAGGVFPHWWKYDLGVGITKTVEKLRLKVYKDGDAFVKDFTLQGSNNDADWDIITTQQAANTASWQTFEFSNSTAYRHYKIHITTAWKAGNWCTFWETEMMESHLVLQCYSESIIKQQGFYSLEGFAKQTDSLNEYLERTLVSPIDLSDRNTIKFDIYASRTGAHIKVGIRDSGSVWTEKTHTIVDVNTWETVTWDISGVSNTNKDGIDRIKITILNADADNTFYTDNFFGEAITTKGRALFSSSNF